MSVEKKINSSSRRHKSSEPWSETKESPTITGHKCGELSLNWTLLSISEDSDTYTHISFLFFNIKVLPACLSSISPSMEYYHNDLYQFWDEYLITWEESIYFLSSEKIILKIPIIESFILINSMRQWQTSVPKSALPLGSWDLVCLKSSEALYKVVMWWYISVTVKV